MYHSTIELKEGAYLVSDAHYSSTRPELLYFLKAIQNKELLPIQLIFMGDIFDTLFGGVTKTLHRNDEAIAIINELSKKIEVIYLEGNHDFNIKNIFPFTRVFTIKEQPIVCKYNNKTIILAHGDFDGPLLYQTYTLLIRNAFFLKILNLFDTYILKKLDSYLGEKDDCKELSWFEESIQKRIAKNYTCDYFIEGHFHQNKSFQLDKIKYINLGAFACNQRYFIVKSSKEKELLEENIFSKET